MTFQSKLVNKCGGDEGQRLTRYRFVLTSGKQATGKTKTNEKGTQEEHEIKQNKKTQQKPNIKPNKSNGNVGVMCVRGWVFFLSHTKVLNGR